jgi:hypothetical protein
MSAYEIITIISGILTALISSGTVIVLIQLRTTNRKISAEVDKSAAETKKIAEDEKINAFQAQITAADKLSTTMSNRLDILTNRITDYEKRDIEKETRINELENSMVASKLDRSKLRIKIREISGLLEELLQITHQHIYYHTKVLELGLLPDFPEVSANLIKDVENIEERFKNIMKEE